MGKVKRKNKVYEEPDKDYFFEEKSIVKSEMERDSRNTFRDLENAFVESHEKEFFPIEIFYSRVEGDENRVMVNIRANNNESLLYQSEPMRVYNAFRFANLFCNLLDKKDYDYRLKKGIK